MKQENTKKSKLWLWLLLAFVAVAAAVGVGLMFLLPGQQEAPAGEETPQSELYWNIDGEHFMEISDVSGMSAREIGEDGMYHIRFVVNGEQKEFLVADKRLVNYIDSMQLMGLVFDENGYVIDALDVKTIANEIAKEFFVKKLENGILHINSSRLMNGMPLEVQVTDTTIICDMTAEGDNLGKPGQPEAMDKISVYSSLDGTRTIVFIMERAPEMTDVYWRVERCFADGKTTREPDKDGIYTMEFAVNGQVVELKCKDVNVVNTIDSAAVLLGQFALVFDEEGYITGTSDVGAAIRGTYLASDYHVTEINGDMITVSKLSGNDMGKTQTFKLAQEHTIYQCCQYKCYDHNCGEKVESLQLGDRCNVYADLEGDAKLIFVTRRKVDSPMYYNFDRQYGGNMEVGTLRKPVKGYYVFQMLVDGKVKTVRVKDKKVADYMESIYNRCMGLKLNGDIVEGVYDAVCVYGGANLGTESYVTALTGSVITISSAYSDSKWNSILAPDCKVYNVIQGEYGAKVGGEIALQEGDQVTTFRNIHDQIQVVFVMNRPVSGGKVYYNLQRKYNTAEKTTTREPDAEGYYTFLMATGGKQVTVKTKNKGMASFIDEQLAPLVGLKVNKNNIITNAYSVTAVLKQAAKTCNYRYVEKVTKKTFNTFYYPSATPDKKVVDATTWQIAKNCVVYNVSTAVTEFRGEKSTLKNGDYIQAIKDLSTGEITQIWIMQRNPAYGVKNYDAYCEHCDKKVTWEPYIGKITGEKKHYFLFTDMAAPQVGIGYTTDAEELFYDIVLDLNGKTLTGDGRCFLVYDKLTVMDTKGGGKLMGTNPNSSGSKVSGGCIMVGGGGKLDILGGTLGQSAKSTEFGTLGGTLYIGDKGAEVNMYGGTLLGGETTQSGGNVGIYGGTFVLHGGEIKGGKSPLGANIYANNAATVKILGGTIDGGIELSAKTTLELSGAPTITGTGLSLSAGRKLDPTTLNEKASITVNAIGVFTVENEKIADYQKLFKTVLPDDKIIVRDNALCYISSGPSDFVLDTDNDGMALCPACNEEVAWTPVTGRLGAGMSGHYYLNADIKDGNSQWATTTAKDAVLCVHMNGHTLTTSGRIAVVGSGGTINIMGDGTIIGSAAYSGTDAEVYTKATLVAVSTGSINLYDNVKVTAEKNKPVVYVKTGFTLNDNAQLVAHEDSPAVWMEHGSASLNGGKVYGDVLATVGKLTLDGAVEIDDIGIAAGAKLHVEETFTGNGSVIFEAPLVDEVVPAANGSCSGSFTGKLVLTEYDDQLLRGEYGRLLTGNGKAEPAEPNFVLDSDGDNKAVCPVCGGAEVEWKPLEAGQRPGTATSGHFYLAADSVNTDAQYATTTDKAHKICLHMNGKNLTTAGRIAVVGAGGTINIMGKGTITSKATSAYSEATLVAGSGGTVSIFDDVTLTIAADGKPVVELRNNTTLNLNDNAKIMAKDGGVGITVAGKFFVNDAASIDNMSVAAGGKLTVNGNWTGTADVTFASALVDGVVPAANGASTGAFTGTLTMGDQKLYGVNGGLSITESQQPEQPEEPEQPEQPEPELTPDASGYAECPVCKKSVQWTPVTASLGDTVVDGGHYYLTGNYDNPNQFMTVTQGKTVCFHNNGYTLTYPSRIFVTGATLNMMGSGSVVGKTTTADTNLGAVVAAWSKGVINLYGGTYSTDTDAPALKLHGDNSVRVNVYDGVVIENALIHKGTLTLYGKSDIGKIDVEATGKLVVDSTWTGTAKVTFASALVDGVVPEANGASTGSFTGSLTMDEQKLTGKDGKLVVEVPETEPVFVLDPDGNNKAVCPVCGGEEVQWTPVEAGKRVGSGVTGHYYLLEDSVNNDGQYATTTSKDHKLCLHLNGKNLTAAGRIAVVGNGGNINIMGAGSITSTGTGQYSGATLVANSTGAISLYDDVTVTISAENMPVVSIGVSSGTVNLYGNAKVQVQNGGVGIDAPKGNVSLNGAACAQNIQIGTAGKLTVNADWTGAANVTFASPLADGVVPAANGASTGSFTGTLTMGEQKLIGADGKLMVDDTNPEIAKGNAVAAAAAAMDFTNYQTGTAVRCPVCEKDVTWTAVNSLSPALTDGGHYYLAKDISGTGIFLTVSGSTTGKTVCLHLNGKTVSYGARVFATAASAKTPGVLNLMGNGTLTSDGSHADYGTGTVHAAGSGIINLYGGTYKSTAANSIATLRVAGGTINMYSGATVDSKAGTNVLMEKGTFNLYGGTIKNGTGFVSGSNLLGGNVYLKTTGSVFNMVDGTITGGSATYGGNVRLEAGCTFTMDGGTIGGAPAEGVVVGTATSAGGNVSVGGTFNMNAGTVIGGTTVGQGGNFFVKGVLNIGEDAVVTLGTAKEGGNIHLAADTDKTSTLNTCGTVTNGTTKGTAAHGGNISGTSRSIINITGGVISGGNAAGQGGNVRVYNGKLTVTGGEIFGGTAAGAANHNVWLAGADCVMTFTGGTVKGVDGTNSAGTAIMANGGVLYLGGNANAIRADGVAKGNIYTASGVKLNVLNDFTGTASVKLAVSYAAGATVADTNAQCGALAEGVFTAGGSYTGTLMNENGDAVKLLGVEGALVLEAAQ